MIKETDARARFAERFGLAPIVMERLDIYAILLRKWQKTVNLVGPKTIDSLWIRHFWDSAQLLDFLRVGAIGLILAPAAAFPGLVIAVMLSGDSDAVGAGCGERPAEMRLPAGSFT
jgi:16S rRNA (guanine527-N7)-methyltransferase